MIDEDLPDITSVAVEPAYCFVCGASVGTTDFEGRETAYCSECDLVFSQNAVAGVHVIVKDDEGVLLLDEPVTGQEGVLSLPGGATRHDEGPKKAALRELEEETGLSADPADLEYLTTYHADLGHAGFYFLTYTLEWTATEGTLRPEFEEGELAFRPVEEVPTMGDRIRDSDRERIAMAFGDRSTD